MIRIIVDKRRCMENFLMSNPREKYLLSTSPLKGNLDTLSGTGTAMLFSAGTFLYVATVHVLPEVKNVGCVFNSKNPNPVSCWNCLVFSYLEVTNVGHGHSHGGEGKSGFSKAELVTLVVGAILPLFLTMGHHH